MRLFREHLVRAAIIVCVFAILFTVLSFLMTQMSTTTYWNPDRESLGPMESRATGLIYDEGAEAVEITITYNTDAEFDVWLVDDAAPGGRPSSLGMESWVRHGIAGDEDIEWTVSADEYEGELRIFEENSYIGDRGTMFGGTTVNYDWRITTRSIEDPLTSPSTFLALGLTALAAILLAIASNLPREGIRDFRELYPHIPRPGDPDEVEPLDT